MQQGFDKDYWESHWQQAEGHGVAPQPVPRPRDRQPGAGHRPGRRMRRGRGGGLARRRGLDRHRRRHLSAALAHAAERATAAGASDERLRWVEADLSVWEPGRRFDLVTTHYAHPAMPQLDFYERIAGWVAPGGTLLVVGHLHTTGPTHHAHADQPPEEATVTAAGITARLDAAAWDVVTADERVRTVSGRQAELHDVVVRATRRRTP